MNTYALVAALAAGAPASDPSAYDPAPVGYYAPAGYGPPPNPYFAAAPQPGYPTLPISGAGAPPAVAMPAPGMAPAYVPAAPANPTLAAECAKPVRGLFQSDHEFDDFIGPVSNPIFAKDPRSNSHARFLFINNNVPGGHPLAGNIQVYALQTNLAVTERLNIIADKDGIANIDPRRGPSTNGFLNLAAGLKYTFYRDVENQTLASIGFLYEIPTGEAKVQQNHGSGSFAGFLTVGQEFGDKWHVLHTGGYYTPLRASQGSSFVFNSFHIDKQMFGWLYPLAEANWFWYTSGGRRLPAAFGEGDGLLNLGTQGQAGAHLVTLALGAKAILTKNYTVGFAYEFPVSNRKDIINNRLTVELIGRY